jgi:hypothetical protein
MKPFWGAACSQSPFLSVIHSPCMQEFTKPLELKAMNIISDEHMHPQEPFFGPQHPHAQSAMDSIRNVLAHTCGDFTTLLSLEKFFRESSRHQSADFSGALPAPPPLLSQLRQPLKLAPCHMLYM